MKQRYNESLITSEVCMRCGDCCKLHMTGSANFGLKNEESRKFIKSVLIDHESIDFKGWDIKDNVFGLAIECSKLLKKEDGTVACGIYPDRPKVCRDYNCLHQANKRDNDVRADAKVRKAVREVHGCEIEMPL
jgi:Fe-S-cluster containining protein